MLFWSIVTDAQSQSRLWQTLIARFHWDTPIQKQVTPTMGKNGRKGPMVLVLPVNLAIYATEYKTEHANYVLDEE